METIINFFNHPFFSIVGGISTSLVIFGFLYITACWFLGIAPLLKRLGLGRWFRKISIVSDDESYESLESDLVDSGIFKEKNVERINLKSIAKLKSKELIIVHCSILQDQLLRTILSNKKHISAIIFYCPGFHEDQPLSNDQMNLIGKHANTTVVTSRGRLLNDVMTSLITVSYEKK